MTSYEREPSKRKIKPPSQPLLDLEFGESSDDSDFNIDNVNPGSDDDDDDDSFSSDDEKGTDNSSESDSEEDEVVDGLITGENDKIPGEKNVTDILQQAALQFDSKSAEGILICCACLGDRSDHVNEIVECDSCGVTVHEGCYGVSDSLSVSSTESLCPTEPWFCEACRAGVTDPSCELCPNKGGIFKATDVGRWVHLVCALYVPGVAFGEVEGLTNVTLFEMPYNKWGAKTCVLCEDERLASTGVNIGCDAGMCRTFFHVTCAQREGLLSEAHSEEVDQADPFYAHCKLHTDKSLMKRRKRNYIVMQYNIKNKALEHAKNENSQTPEALRIQRKLAKKRAKYLFLKNNQPKPWVPTQKMPRLLTTSAAVCRELWRKAELMGIDSVASETKETRAAVLADISKKWHIPPAFSFEFTGYFLDRNNRIPTMKKNLEALLEANKKLTEEQEDLKQKYEKALKIKQEVEEINTNLKKVIEKHHSFIQYVFPGKRLPVIEDLMVNHQANHSFPNTMMVPTPAALKAGVGYPLVRTNFKIQQPVDPKTIVNPEQPPALTTHECGICHSNRDQHLLAKCDTCHLYYHLGCLHPPLTRMPKKTKLMGWQCSECDKESGNSEMEDVEAPRRLRYSKEDSRNMSPRRSQDGNDEVPKSRREKKRRREKHQRYSPELLSSKKHKKKKKNSKMDNLPRIKIKIKAIPNPTGGGVSSENTQMFVASSDIDLGSLPSFEKKSQNCNKNRTNSTTNQCATCGRFDETKNLVMCDDCQKSFHFGCLDPPLKKSPKMRGYSWHCADCDPTGEAMPLQVEGNRIQVLGPVVSANMMGSVRRARELSDIAPQYIAKSGLCSASELESSRGGSIRIQHVTALSGTTEGKSRFPKLDECAHFHYEHVDIGPIQVALVDDEDLKPLSNETEEEKWWSLSVTSQNKTWLMRRSYENFRMLDQQLHRCIFDRKFSELPELPAESIEEKENLHKLLSDYVSRFSVIAGSQINCGPILNWLELDNRGHRLIVPDTDNCPINTPAVAAAYSVKRYTAQAPDEISFEVGDMISVIDMPPSEESIWWRGKRGFQVGFFPCECVAVIGDKVPRNLQFTPQLSQPTKPVLRKHGKLIAFFRSFILSRPSRRRLKQTGILKERVFGCDLGEHLLNSGHEIPMVLKCCVEFIESHGLIDGIYRLSGVTSNIQKLRNAFDEDRVPALYEDEAILQDVHSVASLLKMYFRELPNPLCTYQLYHQFVGAVQATQGDDTRLLKMRDVVQKLPPPHYRTLEYLMRHLARVSEKGHETGMTSRNVAIVWAPNLLRCKELEVGGVAALQGVGVQAVVTEFLVCYADLIFCDKLPNFSLPSQQVCSKKTRPKSLAISTPTKLLSLEEARNRALLQAAGKVEQDYIEVGGGPANLPAKYHTVIELPGGSRKRMGSKRSPIGWKMFFGKSGRGSQSRKDIQNKNSTTVDLGLGPNKAVTELDLAPARRRLRPAKSVESLTSNRNSGNFDLSDPPPGFSSLEDTLSPILLRNGDGIGNGHNRSVSHESYFDQLQDQKEDVALDISEIQVNFELEESEMRIFSEDETLMSVGSGSLASNSSPRILPMQKSGKSLISKRLSYPKLGGGGDRFCSSQSADPSPKKQKINDGMAPRSKLEEQLSSSVGEIQFIDSVSPDQVLVQAEIHPIQSPSPVNSISQISSSLLAPSSPILPHIPHLMNRRPQSEEITTQTKVFNSSKPENEKTASSSLETPRSQLFSTVPDDLTQNTYLPSPGIAETIDNESVSLQSYELTTPETPVCESYITLVNCEESSVSSTTTPDFDSKVMKSLSESEYLDKAMITANLEFGDCRNIGMEFAKFEEKIISDDSVDAKPSKTKTDEALPPKPEERKPKPVHPYVNIPFKPLEESRKVLETSFDFVENPEETSNRNSVISIKYEAISTESSCDSLMNDNREEENSFLLGVKSVSESLSDQTSGKMESSMNSNSNPDEEEKKESEMDLLKECSDWLQTKQEFYLSNDTKNDFSGVQETGGPSESDFDDANNFNRLSEPLQSDFITADDQNNVHNNDKTDFEGRENLFEQKNVETVVKENETEPSELILKKPESCILETNLDEVGDLDISLISPKKILEKPVAKKRSSPQKSNSSGNVRQLLSKFEISPTSEKNLVDLKLDFENRKKGKKCMEDKQRSIEERPKTLERLSTRRKTEQDIGEPREVLMEKSKSGSHINQKASEKGDLLLNCEFDLTDPQRRERIEKYKEKRRNYLREKYRSDSFKNPNDDFVLRIKPRRKEEETEKNVTVEKPARTHLPKSPEKKSSEKLGKGSAVVKLLESPSRVSFLGETSGKQRYESPTISSSIREQSRRNNFLRFSAERKSAGDFRSSKGSPEKKNIFSDFSSGIRKEDKLSPEFVDSYSRRRMTDPSRPEKSSKSSDLTRSHKSSTSIGGERHSTGGTATSPLFSIKDMTALFEKRNDDGEDDEDPKTPKQYLSSV